MSFFSTLPETGYDPIIKIMNAYAQDTSTRKIDVSVGVYKTEDGDPNYVFPCVKKAKKILEENDPGHCYTQMSGIPEFVAEAQKTVFGANHPNLASVQAVSGSGALHLAFELLIQMGLTDIYVGTPAWVNYQGMIEHSGGKFIPYNYYNESSHTIDFDSVLKTLQEAPAKSVFVLQAVCHNPTGLDMSKDQWLQIFELIKEKNHFPLFDIAYQGFASGDTDKDAWAIREAYRQNIEFIACQSYSKNMGLYSERVGCTHVCSNDATQSAKIKATLTSLVRHEFSFAPAFGARVSTLIQQDEALRSIWKKDVLDVTTRIKSVRQKVLAKLTQLGTPGSWDHVVKSNGLFWFSGLTPLQTTKLIEEHHIYGTSNGRVNVAGLNDSNIDAYCEALDAVVRKY